VTGFAKKESALLNGKPIGNHLCALRYERDPDFGKQLPLSDAVDGDLCGAKSKRLRSPFTATVLMAIVSVEIANAPMWASSMAIPRETHNRIFLELWPI
jgi:hypothetical protein